MEEKTMSYRWLRFKCKMKQAYDSGKQKVVDFVHWCTDNPIAATAIASVAVSGFKTVRKGVIEHNAEVRRRRRLYDTRTGRYSWMRRDPDEYESVEIDRRFKAGESYEKILSDMGLRRR